VDVSRGLSWRQRSILKSLKANQVTAWKDVDYGPTTAEGRDDFFGAREQWNLEQSIRRALKSLDRRGLVKLGRYVFEDEPVPGLPGFIRIVRHAVDPERHVPGQTRIMIGATLTEAGEAMVKQREKTK
jgi:hypothetical protein